MILSGAAGDGFYFSAGHSTSERRAQRNDWEIALLIDSNLTHDNLSARADGSIKVTLCSMLVAEYW